jgi:hypothetical protein
MFIILSLSTNDHVGPLERWVHQLHQEQDLIRPLTSILYIVVFPLSTTCFGSMVDFFFFHKFAIHFFPPLILSLGTSSCSNVLKRHL